MNDPADVRMSESDHMSTTGGLLNSGTGVCHAVGGGHVHHEVVEVEELLASVAGSTTPASPSQARAVDASRTVHLRSDAAGEPETTLQGGVENPPVELPSEPEMERRLEIICVGGQGAPTESSGRVPGLKASNELIRRFKGENEDIHEANGARGQLRRLRHAPASLGDGAIRVRAPVR